MQSREWKRRCGQDDGRYRMKNAYLTATQILKIKICTSHSVDQIGHNFMSKSQALTGLL